MVGDNAAGLYGFRAEAAYSAAKAGVAMLARVGADELGRYGATVNAVAPVARTRLTEWLGEAPASPGASPGDDPLAARSPGASWKQETARSRRPVPGSPARSSRCHP